MDSNPYAAPLATEAPPADVRESVRRQHLSHEASVKGIGSLYLLGSIIFTISSVLGLIGLVAGSGAAGGAEWGIMIFMLAVAVLQFWLGQGLRKLQSNVRGVATIFAAIGLIGFPIGTAISAYILYLLWSAKGSMVFSPEYQEIIAATPHIRYKTSIVVWILLGIVLLLIVFGIAAAFLGSRY